MAANSHIEWTEATWNPVTGCTKITPDARTATLSALRHGCRRWETFGIATDLKSRSTEISLIFPSGGASRD